MVSMSKSMVSDGTWSWWGFDLLLWALGASLCLIFFCKSSFVVISEKSKGLSSPIASLNIFDISFYSGWGKVDYVRACGATLCSPAAAGTLTTSVVFACSVLASPIAAANSDEKPLPSSTYTTAYGGAWTVTLTLIYVSSLPPFDVWFDDSYVGVVDWVVLAAKLVWFVDG